MNNEHFQKKIDALKKEIVENPGDKLRDKLDELLLLQRQADVIPVELIIEEGSVVKRYPISEAMEIVRCKTAIFLHSTCFWVVSKPTLANNMRGGALYEMLDWYCDYMDSRDEYTDEERDTFDIVCTMIVNILSLPLDAFTDMNYCIDVAHHILTSRADYYNRIADEATKESEENFGDALEDAVLEAEEELREELAGELRDLSEKKKLTS